MTSVASGGDENSLNAAVPVAPINSTSEISQKNDVEKTNPKKSQKVGSKSASKSTHIERVPITKHPYENLTSAKTVANMTEKELNRYRENIHKKIRIIVGGSYDPSYDLAPSKAKMMQKKKKYRKKPGVGKKITSSKGKVGQGKAPRKQIVSKAPRKSTKTKASAEEGESKKRKQAVREAEEELSKTAEEMKTKQKDAKKKKVSEKTKTKKADDNDKKSSATTTTKNKAKSAAAETKTPKKKAKKQ